MKTPLGRVRGLGSARSGTKQFWRQRLSSIALIPLAILVVVVLVMSVGDDHATVVERLRHPIVSVGLILAVAITGFHMRLGLQEVIEDYVHETGNRFAVTVLLNLLACGGAALSIVSILKIALGAAA